MSLTYRSFCHGFALLSVALLVGCSGAKSDSGTLSPEFFAKVGEVEELKTAVKSAAADELRKVATQIHEAGHILVKLPKIAAKDSVSEEVQAQIEECVDSLMDGYGWLDKGLHGGPEYGKPYDEVSTQIDSSLATLQSLGADKKDEDAGG